MLVFESRERKAGAQKITWQLAKMQHTTFDERAAVARAISKGPP